VSGPFRVGGQVMMESELLKSIVSQGPWAVLAVWLIWDAKKQKEQLMVFIQQFVPVMTEIKDELRSLRDDVNHLMKKGGGDG
jgi:hypothetical protein